MWTPLRKEILNICKRIDASEQRFKPVPMQDWESIQDKILQKFCYPNRIGWIWERLKEDSYTVQFNYNNVIDKLSHLLADSEIVWLFLNETVTEQTKYWFYEGYVSDIISVLKESKLIDEVYIASKKYEWLLCVNHHDYIIATGSTMPERLLNLEKTT